MLNSFKGVISIYLAAIITFFGVLPSVISECRDTLPYDIAEQKQRVEQLAEDYEKGNYEPVDENDFTSFDLEEAYNNSVKFNEVAFIGTHNSYQKASTSAFKKLYGALDTLSFGAVKAETGDFASETLTNQFNMGIRSIELDIEVDVSGNTVSFITTHSPTLDMTTTCYDFELALKEIKLWSDANSKHLPITIIIEPKTLFVPTVNLRVLNMKYESELESLIRRVMGSTLLTPADMMRNYDSLKQMRENDDWMTLKEMQGKVLFLLHPTDITTDYIQLDTSLKTQVMFPTLVYANKDEDWASVLIMNKPEQAVESGDEIIKQDKFIVRTRADQYTAVSETDRENAFASGAQIISTDYPRHTYSTDSDYIVSFDGGYTVSYSLK